MEQDNLKNPEYQVSEEEVYQLADRLGVEFSGPDQISQLEKAEAGNSTNFTSVAYIYSTYISQVTGLTCEYNIYHSGGGLFRFYTEVGPQNVRQMVLNIYYTTEQYTKATVVFYHSFGQVLRKLPMEEFTDRFESIDWRHLTELVTNQLSDASNRLCSTIISQFNSVEHTFTKIEDVGDYISQKVKEASEKRNFAFYHSYERRNNQSLDEFLLQNLELLFELESHTFAMQSYVGYNPKNKTYKLKSEPDFRLFDDSDLQLVGKGLKLSVRDESDTHGWNFGFGIVDNQFMFWMADLTFSNSILQGAETVCKLDFKHLCNQLSEVCEQIKFEIEKLSLELMLEFNI